jgi:hypothetical protein
MVSVTNVLVTSALSVLHTEIAHLAASVATTSVQSVHVTTAMHALHTETEQSVPAMTVHLVKSVVLMTVQSAHVTTALSVPSVPPTVTVMNVLVTSVLSVPHTEIAHLAESVHLIVPTVAHATSVASVPAGTRTRLLVVPHQTSTLPRMRSHASTQTTMSFLSALKHRRPLQQMLMV